MILVCGVREDLFTDMVFLEEDPICLESSPPPPSLLSPGSSAEINEETQVGSTEMIVPLITRGSLSPVLIFSKQPLFLIRKSQCLSPP